MPGSSRGPGSEVKAAVPPERLLIFRLNHRAPVVGRRSCRARAGIIRITHTITVAVGTTSKAPQSGIVRTVIILVRDPVIITVRTAIERCQSCLVRAVIVVIGDSVAVPVTHRAAVVGRRPGLVRALVIGIGNAIPVGIRTALQIAQSRILGTPVFRILDPVVVRVRASIKRR